MPVERTGPPTLSERSAAQSAAERVAPAVARWFRVSARLGYAAVGVVYLLIAVIAFRILLGWGGTNPNPTHAMQSLELGVVGAVLLIAIGVGMLGYGLWRAIVAFRDPEHAGSGPGGLITRAGFLLSAAMHGMLGVEAFRFAGGAIGAGHPSQSTSDPAPDWTAAAMRLPFGRPLVAAVGAGIAVYAGYELYRSIRWDMRATFETDGISPAYVMATVVLGRVGMAIRAVVIAVIGGLVARAAITFDPGKAAGVAKAFTAIAAWRYGRLAVAITAIGFAAFGVYQIMTARMERIDT